MGREEREESEGASEEEGKRGEGGGIEGRGDF